MREHLTAALADRYDIDHEIGRGGMATVWLATDRKYRKMVAIKVLDPELAKAVGVDRFLREVRTIATLEHPHIVRLIDSGEIVGPGGVSLPWYAMPHVAGESLRARLEREGPLPVEEALRVTEQVADALAAAHRQGIVHRDVKPDNILLSGEHAYLADFGIAKALLETGVDKLTSTGVTIGTLAYMSPEQATSDVLDHRSDQYSLACVLYEMLTGEPPFTGRTPQAVVARRMAESARPVRTVRPAVPAEIDAAILRALERVPADRFADVTTFGRALRDGSALVPSWQARRAVPLPALLATAALAVVAFAVVWARGGPSAAEVTRSPEVSALYERGVRGYDERTPQGILEAVEALNAAVAIDSTFTAGWARLGMAYVRAQERAFAIPGVSSDSMLRLAIRAADRAIALDPSAADAWVVRGTVSRVLDPTDVRVPLDAAGRAVALDPTNAVAWHVLAVSRAETGDMAAALESWRRSVAAGPTYSQGLAFMGIGLYWTQQYDEAARWADSAITVDPTYLLGRTAAGEIAIMRGDRERANAAFEAARLLSSNVEEVNGLAFRARAAAYAGDRASATNLLNEAEALAVAYSPTPLHTAAYMAEAYAALDDADRAIAWAARYAPNANLHYQLHLRCDPPFVSIEDDPRFEALLIMPRPRAPATC